MAYFSLDRLRKTQVTLSLLSDKTLKHKQRGKDTVAGLRLRQILMRKKHPDIPLHPQITSSLHFVIILEEMATTYLIVFGKWSTSLCSMNL